MAGEMKYRLPVTDPSRDYMSAYIRAIRASKNVQDNRGFFHYAGIHGIPGRWCWHHQFSSRSNLTARIFLPWHRAYLHRLEKSLQDIDADTAIPWWDWTKPDGIPLAFNSESIDGELNPLFDSEVLLSPPQVPNPISGRTSRNPGDLPVFSFPVADINQDGRATLAEIVDYLIDNVDTFEQFNDILESIHDAIHGYVGGTMASSSFAAFDPIFYSHHCMVDRIWSLWQQKHGVDNFPFDLRQVVLEPFGLTVGQVLNTQSLGYEYANFKQNIPLIETGMEQ